MSILYLTTAQAVPFKNSIDAVGQCHITEATLVASDSGLMLTHIDPSHVMVVRLLLERPSFQEFKLGEKEVRIGINIPTIIRALKGLTNKDTISLQVDYADPKHFTITVYNDFTKNTLRHKFTVLLLQYDKIDIPVREVDRMVSMPSHEFSRLIKDFSHLCKNIEFTVESDTMTLRTYSDLCVSEAEVRPKTNIRGEKMANGSVLIGLGRNGNTTVRQRFNTRCLLNIIKGNNLDDQVTLYFTESNPLIVRFNISVMGSIMYILAPSVDEDDEEEGDEEEGDEGQDSTEEDDL